MRMILRGIVNGSTTPLADLGLEGKKIKQVYTILDEKAMMTKFNPQTGEPYTIDSLEDANIRHWYTVFVEDPGHDWFITKGRFRFGAHSGKPGDVHDLLITVE